MTVAQIYLLVDADRRFNSSSDVQRETGSVGDLVAMRQKVAS